jgi:hypothetical protein
MTILMKCLIEILELMTKATIIKDKIIKRRLLTYRPAHNQAQFSSTVLDASEKTVCRGTSTYLGVGIQDVVLDFIHGVSSIGDSAQV